MAEIKRCVRCREDLPIEEFRYYKSQKYYSSVCRRCELRIKSDKESRDIICQGKRSIKRILLRIIPLMRQADFDSMIYELKQMYKVNSHDS